MFISELEDACNDKMLLLFSRWDQDGPKRVGAPTVISCLCLLFTKYIYFFCVHGSIIRKGEHLSSQVFAINDLIKYISHFQAGPIIIPGFGGRSEVLEVAQLA